MPKINSRSFVTGLTAGQREELFFALRDGVSYEQAREKIYEWYQQNAGAQRIGFPVVTEIRRPSVTAIGEWYRASVAEQRYGIARETAGRATPDGDPVDYNGETRRALDHARYLAAKEDLSISALATLDRNELARGRLALAREKLALDARHQQCTRLLERAQKLVESAPTKQKTERDAAAFQLQIDLALEEIERMKYGDDYLWLSPEYFIGPHAPILFMQEFNRS